MELHRVLKGGGYFYCDLISGDATGLPSGFDGEITVETRHENGTVQSYFDRDKIDALFAGMFSLKECVLLRRIDWLTNTHTSRWHLVLHRR